MRYRRVAAGIALVLLLGLIGSVSGPGWNPQPLQDTIVPETEDTAIGSEALTPPVGTYATTTDVLEVAVDDGVTVLATVRAPVGAPGERPALLFMHGAGTATHENFAEVTEALASAGIVTMVPDKRMDTYTTRSRDYLGMAEDYLDSLEVLLRRPDVDRDRVGVYGESEGALVAPVAAAGSDDVTFAVLVSSPGVPIREQGAFAADSYLREVGVPEQLLRAIPRLLGGELPGGGFRYFDFDATEYQRRLDDEPVLMIYGTRDSSMPVVQGAQQLIDDLAAAGSDDYTIRYYADANHGIRLPDGQLHEDFPEDMARWVNGLPATADASPKIAGDQPEQRFRADPLAHPRWYASGDMILLAVLTGAGLLALAAVVALAARVTRAFGAQVRALPSPLGRLTLAVPVATVATWAFFVAYVVEIADLALNYRTNDVLVQVGWIVVQGVGVLAAFLVANSVHHLLRLRRGGRDGSPLGATAWVVYLAAHAGSLILLVTAAYWGVYPAVV